MNSARELADYLEERGLRTSRIVRAFREVDRADFVPAILKENPYVDHPLPIGEGQTISQPFTVAFMLELLRPEEGQRVLDVGSGSGWTTALLASIVGENGEVLGLERMEPLVAFGRANLVRYGFPHARIEQAGEVLGKPGGRFHRILVSAAAERMPVALMEQLEPGGRMVIPVGNAIFAVERTGEQAWEEERYDGFVFVPLVEGGKE